VALDSRFETVNPTSIIEEYFDFIYGNTNWRTFIRKYSPDYNNAEGKKLGGKTVFEPFIVL